MFKSEVHKAGYLNLKKDFELLSSVSGNLVTRMTKKNWDRLTEEFWDEVLGCLDEKWVEDRRVQKRIDEDEWVGSLEGIISVVDFYIWANSIPGYLVEAYTGYYEDEMARDMTSPLEEPEDVREWVITKIHNHNPKQQLKIYLEWNGILGWTDNILSILQIEN